MKAPDKSNKAHKLLFICKKRMASGNTYCTLSSGLFNSANFVVEMLNKNYIEAKLVEVVDNNDIDKVVSEYKPDVVIIEALWVVPEKFDILKKLHPHVHFIVRIHSEIPFLANEGIAIKWMKDYIKKGVYLAFNSFRTKRDIEHLLDTKVFYMPNYYPIKESLKVPIDKHKDILDIACFGAIRPLKNQLIQAGAAIKCANELHKTLRFHINTERIEQTGNTVLENIRDLFKDSNHKLIEHRWLNHKDFIHLIKQMDIGMQVSFSETYNIVAADFVNNNIPIVTSDEIEFIARPYLANCTNMNDISAKLRFAYKTRKLGIQKLNKFLLECNSKDSEKEWVNLFSTN